MSAYTPRMFTFLKELPQAYLHPVRFHHACRQATGRWFPLYAIGAVTGAVLAIGAAMLYAWWTSDTPPPWHNRLLLSGQSPVLPYLVLAWITHCTYVAYIYLLVAFTADKRSVNTQPQQKNPHQKQDHQGTT